ncbi:MAG: hypothetical protein IJJ90_05070 [Prevotella sp.]|nr:hypothetical protein [Prevotella sp.]
MDDEKFEVLWQKNRKSLLSEDREWQQLQQSYKVSSGADMLLFGIPAVAGIVSFNYVPLSGELLKWLVSAVVTVLCFVLCVFVKGLFSPTLSASEIEKRVKTDYRKRLEQRQ